MKTTYNIAPITTFTVWVRRTSHITAPSRGHYPLSSIPYPVRPQYRESWLPFEVLRTTHDWLIEVLRCDDASAIHFSEKACRLPIPFTKNFSFYFTAMFSFSFTNTKKTCIQKKEKSCQPITNSLNCYRSNFVVKHTNKKRCLYGSIIASSDTSCMAPGRCLMKFIGWVIKLVRVIFQKEKGFLMLGLEIFW